MVEMTDEQAARKNRNFMLHVLRNPYGWGDDVVREIRLKAADELERLWGVESAAKQAAEDFSRAVPNASGKPTTEAAKPL